MCTVPASGATSWCSIFMASTVSSDLAGLDGVAVADGHGHHGAGHRRAHRRVGGAFLAFDRGQHPGQPRLAAERLEAAGPAPVAEIDELRRVRPARVTSLPGRRDRARTAASAPSMSQVTLSLGAAPIDRPSCSRAAVDRATRARPRSLLLDARSPRRWQTPPPGMPKLMADTARGAQPPAVGRCPTGGRHAGAAPSREDPERQRPRPSARRRRRGGTLKPGILRSIRPVSRRPARTSSSLISSRRYSTLVSMPSDGVRQSAASSLSRAAARSSPQAMTLASIGS